ncbi:MAG: hypothetical protein ABI456_13890 [Ktedonobacteraceae bacterium]
MLTDRVYRVRYRGQQHILHLEMETGSLVEMPTRLLFYHAGILDRYQLPVISMVIYPFQVSMAESPLQETSGPEEILIFHFKTLPLWKLDARWFLQEHAVSMYALLPAMAQNKFRETIMGLVQERFPALQAVVAQKIAAIYDTDALQKIILALALAPDEVVARHYVATLEPVPVSET